MLGSRLFALISVLACLPVVGVGCGDEAAADDAGAAADAVSGIFDGASSTDGAPPAIDGAPPTSDGGPLPPGSPFVTGALVAGGRTYQIVARPDDADKLLASTDVGGIQRSSDGGDNFSPSNDGLDSAAALHVGSVQWSTRSGDTAATAYACTDVGIYRSTNDGKSWSLIPGSGGYDCNGNGHFEPKPRQAGQLLATLGEYLFVGSKNGGVGRWNGASWTSLGLAGSKIQGLSADSGTLYVAVGNSGSDNGVYRIDAATGSPASPSLLGGANSPGEAWDVTAFNAAVWVAATGGIHRYSGGSWSKWRPAGGASDHFSAIAGGHEGATPFVYAGLQGGAASNTSGSLVGGVWKTSADSVTWTDVTKGGTMQIECNAAKPLWTDKFNVIGYSQWRPANISTGDGALRANFWKFQLANAAWCPTVDGLLVTGATNIAIDPDAPADVYASTADYGIIHSWSYGVALAGQEGIEKYKHSLPGATGNADRSLAVGFDRTAGDVVATTGNRNVGANNDADIIYFPKENFGAKARIKGNLPDKRIWAVGVNRVASCGPDRIVVAALENGGIWRNEGNGSSSSWSRVDGGGVMATAFGDFPHVTIEWPWEDANMFLYEPDSGAWRSQDCGATWTQVSTKASTHSVGGYIAYDDGSDTLYVSVTNRNGSGNGVFPIANASGCAPTAGDCSHGSALAGAPARPGAIAEDFDGDLWVVGIGGPSAAASLSYWTGSEWVDRSDDVSTGQGLPLRLAVGRSEDSGQYIYLAAKGNGFIRGKK